MYADDIAKWAKDCKKERSKALAQAGVDSIARWSERAKLSLNPSKCESAFFTTDPNELGYNSEIVIKGNIIPYTKTPKFLGVTFDRTLNFNTHLALVTAKANNRCKMWTPPITCTIKILLNHFHYFKL